MYEVFERFLETALVNHREDKANLYHLSEDDHPVGTVYSPRVPDNYMTQKGLEDNKTPRVCFSTTILGALKGINGDLTGKKFFIYVPRDIEDIKIMYPTDDIVPDARDMGEVWVTSDVTLLQVGKLEVLSYELVDVETADGLVKREMYEWKWMGGMNKAYFSEETIQEGNPKQ